MTASSFAHLQPLQAQLNAHPLYGALRDLADLRVFMSHHVFSVWDFMSLIKYLQQRIAPAEVPWRPRGEPAVRYFINQLVLEEESDALEVGDGQGYGSHFEFYCQAMHEIGADGELPRRFLARVEQAGVAAALAAAEVPAPAREFVTTTFAFIATDKPHVVAAALAWGRERAIPEMFRSFLAAMGITPAQAPLFHRYLERHIHLDEDFHGPLSLRLLESLCGGDPVKHREAEQAAAAAIQARLRFWDGVLAAITAQRVC